MLKFKITEDEFSGLSEEIQGVYSKNEESGEVFYSLQADGISTDEVKGLKTNKNAVLMDLAKKKEELLTAKQEQEALQNRLADLEEKLNGKKTDKNSDDLALLEAKYKADIEKLRLSNEQILAEKESLIKANRTAQLRTIIDQSLPENVHRSALDDILLYASNELEFSESINNGQGAFVTKQGLEVGDWLNSKITEKPHWVKGSVSGGERGGSPNTNNDTRKTKYDEAKKSGDIETMMATSPVDD